MTLKDSDSSFGKNKLNERAYSVTNMNFCLIVDNTVATQINRIISHPTMPIVISGHEDRHIKFFDLKSGNKRMGRFFGEKILLTDNYFYLIGECIESLSGHLDAVTSLDINTTGTRMVSGGKL